MVTKYKVILSGTTTTVPADWNSASNKVHTIGGGGGGGPGSLGGSTSAGSGAAYAVKNNVTLTPGATIDIQVGVAGVEGSVTPTATWVKDAVGGTKFVEAVPGANGNGSSTITGGLAASCTGDSAFNGGNGGSGGTRSGGGGGGAAGPNGAGAAGAAGLGGTPAGGGGGGGANGGAAGTAATNASGGAGGNNRSSTGGGAGGGTASNGGNGTNGGGGGGGGFDTGGNVGYDGGTGSVDAIWTDTDSGLSYGPAGGAAGGGGNNGGPVAGDGGNASYGAGGGAAGSAVSSGTQGTKGSGGPGLIVLEWDVAASSDLSGGVTLDDVASSGTFADAGPTSLSGNVTLGDIAPAGTLGLQPGTVTVSALKNWSGSLQTSVTIPVVTVLSLTTGAQVLALTDQVTHATTADLAITGASIVTGTTYMVAGWNADGSQRFAVPLTAT